MTEPTTNQNIKNSCWWGWCGRHTKRGSIGWGVFFLTIGGYFLAEELGYISSNVSVWTMLLVAFGLYLIIRGLAR